MENFIKNQFISVTLLGLYDGCSIIIESRQNMMHPVQMTMVEETDNVAKHSNVDIIAIATATFWLFSMNEKIFTN